MRTIPSPVCQLACPTQDTPQAAPKLHQAAPTCATATDMMRRMRGGSHNHRSVPLQCTVPVVAHSTHWVAACTPHRTVQLGVRSAKQDGACAAKHHSRPDRRPVTPPGSADISVAHSARSNIQSSPGMISLHLLASPAISITRDRGRSREIAGDRRR